MLATGSHWKYLSTLPQYVFFFSFFFTLLWTQNTQTNKRNTPCCLSSLLFALGQHSSWKLTPKNRNPERFSSFASNELMQEWFEQLMTAAIICTAKMGDFNQTASASWIQTLHFLKFEIVIALGFVCFFLQILGKFSFFFCLFNLLNFKSCRSVIGKTTIAMNLI